MLRDRPRCAHPIQHLLLINFLGHTAQSFFEILTQKRTKPKCAAPFLQKETNQKQIDQKLLVSLWEDRQISLREISRRIESRPNDGQKTRRPSGLTISQKKCKAHAGKTTAAPRALQTAPISPASLENGPRRTRATRAPEASSQHLQLPLPVRQKMAGPALTDRHARNRNQGNQGWTGKQRSRVGRKIREIVLRAPEPLTRGQLLAELGIGNMLWRNPDELKRTREEIQKSMLHRTPLILRMN